MIGAHRELQARYERAQHTVSVLQEAAEHIEKQAAVRAAQAASEGSASTERESQTWERDKAALVQQRTLDWAKSSGASFRIQEQGSLAEASLEDMATKEQRELATYEEVYQSKLSQAQQDASKAREQLREAQHRHQGLEKEVQELRRELQVRLSPYAGLEWQGALRLLLRDPNRCWVSSVGKAVTRGRGIRKRS